MRRSAIYSHTDCSVVCNTVFICTYTLLITLSVVNFIGLLHGTKQSPIILAACAIAFVYMARVQAIARRKHFRMASSMLVAFYLSFAALAFGLWGDESLVGIFTLGVAIILAGVLLKAVCAFRVAILASAIAIAAQVGSALGWPTEAMRLHSVKPSLGSVIAYSSAFGLLALTALFYNLEIDHSSTRAQEAEAILQKQKRTVSKQIKKRTSQLQQIQLEEMQQMYRFAELGQLGAALLHDLANHLTVLTLEIESIQNKQHTEAADRARQTIRYIEKAIDSTRSRLHGSTQLLPFNIIGKTNEAIMFLSYKAEQAGVVVDLQAPTHSWIYVGDPADYCQVIAIIVGNAIDAYDTYRRKKVGKAQRRVVVTMEKGSTHIVVHVHDWGKGISKKQRQRLFKPFYSTKKTGVGIDLFIAKQTMETKFSGTLTLSPDSDHTDFIITLPLSAPKARS